MRTSICSSLFKYGLGLFLIALGWELASLWFRSSLVLPSLSEVFAAFFGLLNDPSLWMHLSSTFFKAFFGLFLALAIGLPLGVLIGLSAFFSQLLLPALVLLKSVPIISWLTSILILWGIGWKAPVFIVLVTLLPIVIYHAANGIKTVDKQLLELVKLNNLPFRKAFSGIYLPSIVPFIVSSVEISIGTMWKTVVAAEFLAGEKGIGVQIAWNKYYVQTPVVFAYTLFVIIIGLGLEILLNAFFSSPFMRRWRGLWSTSY